MPKIAGVKSSMLPHVVAWEINRCFAMNFKLSSNWQKEKHQNVSEFLHFFCRFDDVDLNWHLIMNRGERTWFFNSRPLFDYLLVCNGEDIYNYFERALKAIQLNSRQIQAFQFSFRQVSDKDAYFSNFLKTKHFIEDFHV